MYKASTHNEYILQHILIADHGCVLDSNSKIYMIKDYKPSNACKYYRIEKRNLATRRSTKHTKDIPIKFEEPNSTAKKTRKQHWKVRTPIGIEGS